MTGSAATARVCGLAAALTTALAWASVVAQDRDGANAGAPGLARTSHGHPDLQGVYS
jgi:hypothetical protein